MMKKREKVLKSVKNYETILSFSCLPFSFSLKIAMPSLRLLGFSNLCRVGSCTRGGVPSFYQAPAGSNLGQGLVSF